jgi:putative membrane protein
VNSVRVLRTLAAARFAPGYAHGGPGTWGSSGERTSSQHRSSRRALWFAYYGHPLMGFVIRTIVTAVSLWVADYLLAGIRFEPPSYGLGAQGDQVAALLLTAVVLGVLNAIVRPILLLLSLPITLITLGLFILVINGVVLWLASLIPVLGFEIADPLSAIIGALIVSVVSWLLNLVIPG